MALMQAVAAAGLLVLGLALGWLLRGPARWCPRCGHGLVCLECNPATVAGRASVQTRRPPSSTMDKPLMTPLAERRAPNIQPRYGRRGI